MPHNLTPKKGNIFIYLALIAIVIASMVALKHCTNNAAKDTDIADTGNINIAIEYSPLSLYTYDDTLGGFCYDFLRLIEKRSNHKFTFHPVVTLESTLTGLGKGTYDMVVAQFPATKDNQNKYLFSEALYLDHQVLVQLKNNNGNVTAKSPLDLVHDTVYVVKGSPMRSRIENLSREIGDTIFVAEDANYGPEQLFLRVATGEIEYAVINQSIASSLATHYTNVDYATGISFTQFQPIILRKTDTTLCDSLNYWIEAEKNTPQFKSLQSRYF